MRALDEAPPLDVRRLLDARGRLGRLGVDFTIEEREADRNGFALEGRGGALIERLDGCYSNVIGLSLPLLRRWLPQV